MIRLSILQEILKQQKNMVQEYSLHFLILEMGVLADILKKDLMVVSGEITF
jgi:hypothetical protein